MQMYLTNDVQTKASEHDNQNLHEQYDAIQTECLALRKYYQTLYEHFHALLERSPLDQGYVPDGAAFHQVMHDYCQSLQEQRRAIKHFRRSLHTHLINTRSYRRKQNSRIPAGRVLVRKSILIGVGNEQDAALLKESVQQACTHRVFLAADSEEVLRLVQNVHIDVLVLDDELTPLSGMELYKRVQGMNGLEDLPTIVVSDCPSPLHSTELTHSRIIVLQRPIKGDVFTKAIDQLLIEASRSSQFSLTRKNDSPTAYYPINLCYPLRTTPNFVHS